MHRSVTSRLIGLALLAAGASGPAHAAFDLNGVATITHTEGERARMLNRMNRDDNAFNTYRLFLNGRTRIDEHITLHLEYLFDEGVSAPVSMTFLSPWVRVERLANREWLNLQVGKLPLVFGTWGERATTSVSPVIGAPLISGYHTALRSDLLPVNGDSLRARRGLGQFGVNYSSPGGGGWKGMPTVYEACWDTGLELYGARGPLEYSGAVVYGTPGAPATTGVESNGAPGFEGRLGVSQLPGPLFGARLGVSAARGPWMDRRARRPGGRPVEEYQQVVLGLDAEYGLGPVIVRGEAVRNRWELPESDEPDTWLPGHVDNSGWYVETRVTLAPEWFAGGRVDGLSFAEITSPDGRTGAWDASLHRYEFGGGWRPSRQWEVRAAWQGWRFDEEPARDADLYAVQLRVTF